MLCHCRSEKQFQQCCKPFISGKTKPNTAEELMRSRYTAFCINNLTYIENTMSGPALIQFLSNPNHNTNIKWQKLDICEANDGQKSDTFGTVRFKAYYKLNDNHYCHHERSEFIKVNNQWLYNDGNILA